MEYAALAVAIATLLLTVGLRLFGSGRGLSEQFAQLDKSLTQDIAELRKEVSEKQDSSEAVTHEAISGVKQRMHDLELTAAKNRAEDAKTFMTWDAYREISRDVKQDMKEGFDRIEKRLDRIERVPVAP